MNLASSPDEREQKKEIHKKKRKIEIRGSGNYYPFSGEYS